MLALVSRLVREKLRFESVNFTAIGFVEVVDEVLERVWH